MLGTRATGRWMLALGILGGWALPATAGGPPAPAPEAPVPAARPANDADFDDDDLVPIRSTLMLRAVDEQGRPVANLAPGDLHVQIDDQEIPVKAVAWHDGRETAKPGGPVRRGQLFVVFVQADLAAARIGGSRRLLRLLPELFAALQPMDRVAVFSYDTRLRLWLDFTRDREAASQAIARAFRAGGEAKPALNPEEPSLAAYYDEDEARHVATPEDALRVLAETLEPLAAEKILLYLGFGLGRFGMGQGVTATPAYYAATLALTESHAHVFPLDITPEHPPSLELRVANLAQTLAGSYEVTLDAGALPAQGGNLQVSLRRKKQGKLLMVTFALRPEGDAQTRP